MEMHGKIHNNDCVLKICVFYVTLIKIYKINSFKIAHNFDTQCFHYILKKYFNTATNETVLWKVLRLVTTILQ